ncbi:MAG: 50S ribosomal protein L25 [Candidatus Abyssubacteria bacterium]
MEIVELKAEVRSQTGKKGARECRRMGLLPGVLYGLDDRTIPVAVNPKDLGRVLHTQAGANVIIKLLVADSDPLNVVVKELQVDSIRDAVRHVDFCRISLDEPIQTSVPFRIVGEAPGVKKGGILEHTLWELEIECLPLNIPDAIEVNVSNLDIGDSLAVSDLTVPEGIQVLSDWDTAVVSIVAPRAEAEVVAAPAEEAEEAVPEIIEKAGKEAKGAEKGAEEKKGEDKDEKRKSKA